MRAFEGVDAVVVGAGMSGLYAIYRLRQLGFSLRVFEAGDDVGGTWYWNRYPGARCDVGSMDYSFSFSAELEQEWNWSERYATQPEILRYLNHVADRFDLRRDITFETRVTSAQWDEPSLSWHLQTDKGETVTSQYLIMAPGALSKANTPNFPGMDTFEGKVYHTAAWPDKGVNFAGLDVGLIGTGSSGIQSIPIIAKQARTLTVFQRTPVYAMPAFNQPLAKDQIAKHKAEYPEIRQASRNTGFGVVAPLSEPSALAVSVAERNAVYEQRWNAGALTGLVTAYDDLLIDKTANDTICEFVADKIRGIVKDSRTAELLVPRSFPFGTKRPCLSTDYYETFNGPHVELVDLRAAPILEITPKGVRTAEREYRLDAIVLATGFDAVSGAFLNVDLRGVNGITLREKWADGPRSYLGVAVAGFPNLFTVTGPGSPSVFSNMAVSIEQHIDWITDYMTYLRDRSIRATEPIVEAEDEWGKHVADVGAATLFPLADSWYMGANVAGKPRLLLAYVGGVGAYRAKCDEVAKNGYEGFHAVANKDQAALAR